MKVVILCGGQGTRLREQTELVPKPMIEIGGRPILWHIMKMYSHHGLKEFVLCLGYKGSVIKDYFANYQLRTNDFTVEVGKVAPATLHTSNGDTGWKVTLAETGDNCQTGGRVFRAGKYLDQQRFCLTYGDGLGDVNISELLAFHKGHGKLVTVTGVRPPGRFGELELDGNCVTAFAEKPQVTESFINGGFFVVEHGFVENYLQDDDNLVLEGTPLQKAASDGELMMFPHDGFWQPMDTFREWKLLEEMWEQGQAKWKAWD